MLNDLGDGDMARSRGDSGQAAVLDGAQIRRLLKIASTTSHGQRDKTIITLSYWLVLRAKELALGKFRSEVQHRRRI
jgi:hypothetical protein